MAQTNLQPGSFTIQAAEAVQQRQSGLQLGQTGISGPSQVAAADPLQRQVIDNSTSELLWSLGSKIIEPKIKQQQTKKFLEGAQRVVQGEALKDIVDEQPWFTEIFGPSSSVQGARAVAQMKGVDDYLTDVANDMPELQKLTSEQFGQQVNDRMTKFLTGDAVADAAIQLKMVEASGGLFKAHTKAHYKWTQDVMQQETVGYMRSGGTKLKAMTAQLLNGTMSQADYDEAKAVYVGNLMPMEGQSPASYWGGIEAATIDALATGNHHAANAIFDSGIFNSAPMDLRKSMLDARHTYEARTQETAGFAEYGPRIGQLKGMASAGQLTGNQLLAEIDAINSDYQLRYGIDRPLFKRKEMESVISNNIAGVYRREEQLANELAREGRADARAGAKEAAKAQTELAKSQQLSQLLMMGAGNMATTAGYTQKEVDNGVFQGAKVIEASGGNVGRFLVQQYNEGGEHVNPLYRNQLQAGMRAAKMEGHTGAAFERAHAMTKALSQEQGGTATALAYLGDDGVRMLKYDQLVQTGRMDPTVAYQMAFGEPLDTSRKSTDREVGEAIVSAVDKAQPGLFGRLFTSSAPLTDQSKRVLVSEVKNTYDMLATNLGLDDDVAISMAMELAKGKVDAVGPYIIPRGGDRRPTYQMIGADEETAGVVFTEFLNKEAAKAGVRGLPTHDGFVGNIVNGIARVNPVVDLVGTVRDGDNYLPNPAAATSRWLDRNFGADPTVTILRLPDMGDVGVFAVTVVTPDGDTKFFNMDTATLRDYYEKSDHFK